MKSHLSHLRPVSKACQVLGPDVVHRMVVSLLKLKQPPPNRNNNNRSQYTTTKQQTHGTPRLSQEDATTLIASLSYHVPLRDPLEVPLNDTEQANEPRLPIHIQNGFARLEQLTLDKPTLLHYLVPHLIQPTHAGHMGLFDCLIYLLCGHTASGGRGVLLNDVLIFLSICQDYVQYNDDPTTTTTKDDSIVQTMIYLAFMFYDSYQKKSVLNRDTIHRFLTDIYGDDSYKQQETKAILDILFFNTETIHKAQFSARLQDTLSQSKETRRQHVLLDWIAQLGSSMVPLPELPPSIDSYLDTIFSTKPPLCHIYSISDHKLYESKRRFHSLIRHNTTSTIITGDPMNTVTPDASSNNNKHVISEGSLVEALSESSEEWGTGGYLPPHLAKLLYESNKSSKHNGWSLYNMLQFGCVCVRDNQLDQEEPTSNSSNNNKALLKFLFVMFQQQAENTHVLTIPQIELLHHVILDHALFRERADCPPLEVEDDEQGDALSKHVPERAVPLSTAVELGFLTNIPPAFEAMESITVRFLVELALLEDATLVPNQWNFEEFCQWQDRADKKRQRLGWLMMEFRLIAGILFCVPPTQGTMEVALIAEIDARHRKRYKPSEVSRRGPRGTVWHLIDAHWLKDWSAVLKRVAETPDDKLDGRADPRSDRVRGLPRISNAGLLENNGLTLKPDIRWRVDYELLPPLGWAALQAWYDGGPPIYRSVVKYIASSSTSPHTRQAQMPTENEIELYPYFVTVYLCDAASRGEARPFQQNFQLSRVSPIFNMLVQLCKELDVDPDWARLWVMGRHTREDLTSSSRNFGDEPSMEELRQDDWILSLDQNIVEQRKRRGIPKDEPMTLLLELKDRESGLWPRGVDGNEWHFRDEKAPDVLPTDLGDGVVGLYNMGNTCYLNSSIQCLSHTPLLREYFTSRAFYKDINRSNKMGHGGRLARVSAVLINELWKRSNRQVSHQTKRVTQPGEYSPLTNAHALTPKTFKESLGDLNEIFKGNDQHDAHELLAFLLEGLSEDLNRIVEKPYCENPDSDGRPDSELADIWWSNHLKREMSIIVALFTGQYKSLLTCRTCKYESARFEPFSFLQLPLPEDESLEATVTYYPLEDGASPIKYCVRVRNDGVLRDVLVGLAKVLYEDEMESDLVNGEVIPPSDATKSSDEEESKHELYLQRASNMAMVVMREGYVSKLANGDWQIRDHQFKDSGELPPLHVYELDPVCDDIAQSDDGIMTDDESRARDEQPTFVTVCQRRSDLVSRDFLHPLSHRVFGIPLIIRLNEIGSFSGAQIYDLVAKRLVGIVPKDAVRFLTGEAAESSKSDSTIVNHVGETELSDLVDDGHLSKNRTSTDMEQVAAGPIPRYGFRLRITTREGKKCGRCPWYECCIGCFVQDSELPAGIENGDCIAVDWHFAVDVATSGFGHRMNNGDPIFSSPPVVTRARASPVKIRHHNSCGMGGKRSKGAHPGSVTLEACLDAFAKEEKIPEAYCSKCKEFRVQTKRMSLWRLPPVMIIHLKRFQFTTTMRRKLRDLVVFPTEGLDLSRILAPSAAATHKKENGADIQELMDDGRSEMLYDLYGVVHHQGALSGGHYVASLKSELDGQWRLFNDAQIYEIHSRDVVDASAYILFYIRRDVAKAQLSDYWSVREGHSMSEEDMDNLLKGRSDRCVIS